MRRASNRKHKKLHTSQLRFAQQLPSRGALAGNARLKDTRIATAIRTLNQKIRREPTGSFCILNENQKTTTEGLWFFVLALPIFPGSASIVAAVKKQPGGLF